MASRLRDVWVVTAWSSRLRTIRRRTRTDPPPVCHEPVGSPGSGAPGAGPLARGQTRGNPQLSSRPPPAGACLYAAGHAQPSRSRPAPRLPARPGSAGGPIRALVVAGACGNVGLGKLGQLARLVVVHGIPVVALDPSPAVAEVKTTSARGLRRSLRAGGGRRDPRGHHDRAGRASSDLPATLRVGFVFEAIPERLALKHAFYRQRARPRSRGVDRLGDQRLPRARSCSASCRARRAAP